MRKKAWVIRTERVDFRKMTVKFETLIPNIKSSGEISSNDVVARRWHDRSSAIQ